MTKFEELIDIIPRKKNNDQDSDAVGLEVAGSESSKTPLLQCGDDEIDGSIIDDLYRKGRHKPLEGFGAASWDAT